MGGVQSEMVMPYKDDNQSYATLSAGHSLAPTPTSNFVTSNSQRAPLLRTMYHGVWSMIFPQTIAPISRVGQSWVFDQSSNMIIVAYGCGKDGKCLNDAWGLCLSDYTWRRIAKELREPREYASAVLLGRRMYIFGGVCNTQFFNDLHYIDIDTGECVFVQTNGRAPSARTSPVLFSHSDKSFFLWSGYDGLSHSSVYTFDVETSTWEMTEHEFPGRAAASFCCHKGVDYVFGSAKSHGLISFDPITKEFFAINCTGSEPQPDLSHTTLVSADEYMFLIGGEATYEYMHLFALDAKRHWWFAFHVRPDGESLALTDGIVNKLGLFMMPREFATSVVYDKERRELVCVMGSRLMDPPPIFKISIGNALCSLHMRSDMYEMFKSDIMS